MKKLIILILSLTSFGALATDSDTTPPKANTVYKYKEYEVIDLGSMEIKGQIIAPGDLTISERERQTFKRSLLEKNNFDFICPVVRIYFFNLPISQFIRILSAIFTTI